MALSLSAIFNLHDTNMHVHVRVTPYFSVSVPVSVFAIRVRYFELHLNTILCLLSDGLGFIWQDKTL